MSALQNLEKLLEKTQWESLEINERRKEKSLQNILKHSYETVPFYQKLYSEYLHSNSQWAMIAKDLSALPILSRTMVQHAGSNLISTKIPAAHGKCYPMETSGSTGQPVKILGTDLTNLFYNALMLREHKWHARDYTKKLLAISWLKKDFAPAPIGHFQKTWGAPFDHVQTTGPGIMMSIASSTESQIEGLLHYKPSYLITYPSQAATLAESADRLKLDFSFLEEIRTTGETFTDSYRNTIQTAWNTVKITDIYSSVEIGNIASQCAEYGNYHVNTEHVCVEIVNDENNPCGVNEPGKILLSSLANYATPLIRYEIGDYGAWSAPCPCKRGLPVIKKIYGRKRNRLKLPNGESRFPYLGEREDRKKITDDILKFQFIQHNVNDIEYKIVTKRSLTMQQEIALKSLFQKNFGYPFNFTITYCDHIPNGPTSKYEEFISYVD